MDEFLQNNNNNQKCLTVIFTTRSTKKGNDTLSRLTEHLNSNPHNNKNPSTTNINPKKRIQLISENVDLSNLISVRKLSQRLLQSLPKLDAIILNAGLGGWTGIDWVGAIWGICTDLVHQVSWPTYKLAAVGVITPPQINADSDEPRLGGVFCANVFGHYMLAHNLVPLLKKTATATGHIDDGRIIWISSLEATIKLFDINDIQGLRSNTPYESSKALTDILALTSTLPSTAPWVNSFYNNNDDKHMKTSMHVSHPGICGTSIVPLPLPLFYSMLCVMTIARLLGSPWHTVSTYLGAIAPVWLALSSSADLHNAELPYLLNGGGGRAKWGSSCDDILGKKGEPASTEVDGWGYGGVVGPAVVEGDKYRRRKRGAVDLSSDERVRFEELGRLCWQRMEELRILWDGILDKAGV